VLATALSALQAESARVDTALLYVSDHGESLGEKGLFLHGMPYAIAPEVQKRVPMVFWASPGFGPAAGLAPGCLESELQRKAASPVAHDHLFHTVLGLLDVRTALHEPAWDLAAGCRAAGTAGGAGPGGTTAPASPGAAPAPRPAGAPAR
jgi:lipid A ethanolaminephosphotransferase